MKLFTSQVDTGEQEFYAWACEPGSFFSYTSSGAESRSPCVYLSPSLICLFDVQMMFVVIGMRSRAAQTEHGTLGNRRYQLSHDGPLLEQSSFTVQQTHLYDILPSPHSVWFTLLKHCTGQLHAEHMESHKRHFLLYNLSGICRPAVKTSVLLRDPVPWSPKGLSFSFIFLLKHISYI